MTQNDLRSLWKSSSACLSGPEFLSGAGFFFLRFLPESGSCLHLTSYSLETVEERDTEVDNKSMDTKEEKWGNKLGDWPWHMFTADIMTLRIKEITNENRLGGSGNATQCSAVSYMGRKSKNGDLLGWPKGLFGFFYKMLWKNPKQLLGQPKMYVNS